MERTVEAVRARCSRRVVLLARAAGGPAGERRQPAVGEPTGEVEQPRSRTAAPPRRPVYGPGGFDRNDARAEGRGRPLLRRGVVARIGRDAEPAVGAVAPVLRARRRRRAARTPGTPRCGTRTRARGQPMPGWRAVRSPGTAVASRLPTLRRPGRRRVGDRLASPSGQPAGAVEGSVRGGALLSMGACGLRRGRSAAGRDRRGGRSSRSRISGTPVRPGWRPARSGSPPSNRGEEIHQAVFVRLNRGQRRPVRRRGRRRVR